MNIKDIAKLANVGVGTVSRVLNNNPNVKDSTREKVLKIMKEINYVPNNSARNLKQIKTNSNSIGVLVRGVYNPFFSEMIDLIDKKISQAGYTVILRQNDYDKLGDDEVTKLISLNKSIKLRGLIYMGCDIDEVTEDTFKDIDIPLVLISPSKSYKDSNINNFSSVGINQKDAAMIATKYLIDKGAKNIAIILGSKDKSIINTERIAGYINALNENNINFNENFVTYGEYNPGGAYEATKILLSKNKEIDSIFCISDIMAIGVAKAICEMGLKVGEDVNLIGFDGMDVVKFYNPSIPTIVQPRHEMAVKGVEILFDLIQRGEQHKHVELETELFTGME